MEIATEKPKLSLKEIDSVRESLQLMMSRLREGVPIEQVTSCLSKLLNDLGMSCTPPESPKNVVCQPTEISDYLCNTFIDACIMSWAKEPLSAAHVQPTAHFLVYLLLICPPGGRAVSAALQLLSRKSFENSLQNQMRNISYEAQHLLKTLLLNLEKGRRQVQDWVIRLLDRTFRRFRKAERHKLASMVQHIGIAEVLVHIAACREPKQCLEIIRILASTVRHVDWDSFPDQDRAHALEAALVPLAVRDVWAPSMELSTACQQLLVCTCRGFYSGDELPFRGSAQALAACLAPERKQHGSIQRAAAAILSKMMETNEDAVVFGPTQGLRHIVSLVDVATETRLLNTALGTIVILVNHQEPEICANLIRAGAMTRIARLDWEAPARQEDDDDPHDRMKKMHMYRSLGMARLEMMGRRPALADQLEFSLRCEGPGTLDVAIFLAVHGPMSRLRGAMLQHGGLQVLVAEMEAGGKRWRDAAYGLFALANRLRPATDTAAAAAAAGQQADAPVPSSSMNDPESADVTFMVEGRPFYAHRAALIPCSDVFHDLFTDSYVSAGDSTQLTIPAVPYAVWELVMTFVYTGKCDIPPELLHQVLHVANEYALPKLEAVCQEGIVAQLTAANLVDIYAMCQRLPLFNRTLPNACIDLALNVWLRRGAIGTADADKALRQRMLPELQRRLADALGQLREEPAAEAAGDDDSDFSFFGGGEDDDDDGGDGDGSDGGEEDEGSDEDDSDVEVLLA